MADPIQDDPFEMLKAHVLGSKRSPLEEATATEGVPAATTAAAAPDDPFEMLKAHVLGPKSTVPGAPGLPPAPAIPTATAEQPTDPFEMLKAHVLGPKPPVQSEQPEQPAKGMSPDALTLSFDPASRFADSWTAPGEGVVGHAWGVANTPFVAETDIERWLDPFIGKPEDHGAIFGGIQKGIYDLASGLTSPLSLAFVIGTMGAGALAKSGGEALLRTAGKMSAADIAEVVKGSQYLLKAEKMGKTSDEALIALGQSGINPDVVLEGLETLKKGGMTSHDLIRGGLVHTAGAASLRKVGLSAKQAEVVPKLVQELIDGGFAATNVYGAITAFPSALDALKEGNIGQAAELITTSAGMAGFGLMGTHSLLKEAGAGMDPLLAKLGLHAKPGDTNVRLGRAWGDFDRKVLETARGHALDTDGWRKDPEFADIAKKPEELHRVFNYVQAGGDDELMRERQGLAVKGAGREPGVALRGELPEEAPKTDQNQPTVNAAASDAAVLREPEEYLGGRISAPFSTYNEASKVGGDRNAYVRDVATPDNTGRTLKVQFSSDLINKIVPDLAVPDASAEYNNKLYSDTRPGFARPADFWEAPQWIANASYFLPDSDMYVVRNMEEAKRFLGEAKYDRVLFSALDVNKHLVKELAENYGGRIDAGGYIDPAYFQGNPNVHWHDRMESLARDMGVPYKEGVDYRHFKGSDAILRLNMSKGCLHKCAFCIANSPLELTSKEAIDQQVGEITKMGAKLVYLNDKTFGQAKNYQYLSELNARIKKENPGFHGFVVQTTAAQMTKIPTEWLAKSGIKYVELGVESFNDPLLKEMHKPATEMLINKAVDKLRKNKIALIPNILIGYPGETAETYAHTLDFLKHNTDIISHANIYNLALYADAELGKKMTTASEGDFNENVLEKSWHKDPNIVKTFAGDLYGYASNQLNTLPSALQDLKMDLPETEKVALRPWDELTEREQQQLSIGKRRAVFESLLKHPAMKKVVEELKAAAKVGSSSREWYERSIQAFTVLRELAPKYFRPQDADAWAGVVAATSPQQGVAMNVREALAFWRGWVDNGRPTEDSQVLKLQDDGRMEHLTNQPAKLPNAMRAVRGEDLLPADKTRNFKVGNFANSLRELVNTPKVTFDSWMGAFFGFNKAQVEESPFYHAMALQVRRAAHDLGWKPEQVQAAAWAFIRTLATRSGWKSPEFDEFYKPTEVLGHLSAEDMAQYGEDFADIMSSDKDIRYRLERLGVNLNELDKRLQSIPRPSPVEGATEAGITETLRGPAKRIGEAQQQLKGFTGYSKYQPGTEFDFSKELGAVSRPPGGVYPNVPEFKFDVGFEEKLGTPLSTIKNDAGTDEEAGLYKNPRGEYTLALSGKQLKAFNEATWAPGGGGALEIARGAAANPRQTNGLIDRLLYNADPEKVKLGELLTAAKDHPLAIYRLTGEQPFITMLHEHVHGILSDEQVSAAMDRVKTMPGYDRLAARVRGIKAAGMSYPENEVPGELLSRIVAGQMYGRDVPRPQINAILWEAINNMPSQAAYEKLVGNLEPGVRDQIYGHIQAELTAGKGREISPGAATAPAGRGEARPGIDTVPPERGPRGVPEANGPALPEQQKRADLEKWIRTKAAGYQKEGFLGKTEESALKRVSEDVRAGRIPTELADAAMRYLKPARDPETMEVIDRDHPDFPRTAHIANFLEEQFQRRIPEGNVPGTPEEAGVRKDLGVPGFSDGNRWMIDLKTGQEHNAPLTHNEWALKNGFKGAYDAMDKGFARVLYSPHETYIHVSDKVNLQTAMRRLADIVRQRDKPITVDVGDHTKGYRYYNFANLDEMKEASPADLRGLRKDLEPDEKFVPRQPAKPGEDGIVDWDSPKIYAGIPGTSHDATESSYWVSPKGKAIMVTAHAYAARTMKSSYEGLFGAGYLRVVSNGDGELNIELDRSTPRRSLDNVLKKLDYRPRVIHVDESGATGPSSSRTFGNVRELHQWMAGPRIIPADIEKALKDQNISSGFTINPHTGKTPQVGYAVEVVPEWRRTLSHTTTPADVADFAKSNQKLLEENPHLFIGGSGSRELNISAVFDDLAEAKEVAAKLDQKSIWDVANSKEIDTGGQGKQTAFPDYGIPQRMAVSKFGSIPTDVQGALNLRRDLGPERGVTDKDRLEELAARKLIKEKYTEKEIDALIDSYDPSKLTQAHRNLASKIAVHFRDTLERAQKAGVLEEGLEHYVTQLWQKEADNPAANRLLADSRSGRFAVNTSMARHRVFDHAIEGQLLGRKLAVTDPVALAAYNGATFDRVIAARQLLEHLRDTGTQAADGRPMVALSGTGHIAQGEEGENPAVLIHPDRMQSVRIADHVIDGLRKTGDLDRLMAEQKIVKYGEPKPTAEGGLGIQHYGWATNDYKSMEHPAFQGWKVPSEDTNGNPIFMRSDLKVHPDAHEYMQRQLETKSPLAQALKPAFVAGREAKGILLSFDVFHLVQEALRGVMTGISPFGVERWDLRTNPMLGKLVEHQLTMVDYGPLNTFQEGQMVGHSHLLNKIPGIGPANAWFQDFLFKKYIPGLKARAAEHLYGRYEKLYPEYKDPSTAMTLPDGRVVYPKLLEMAAKDTNMRFGGLNLRREGRAVATQDVFRLVALAPDWLESELRAFSLALGGDGRVMRRDIAKLSVGMWLAARVLNQLNTGNAHYEAPFGVAYKDTEGRDKIVSLRTLPTDILHAVTDPLKFMRYRASPLERTISTVYSGRDEMGRRLPARDLVWDVLGDAAVPLPLQNVAKKMSGFLPEQDWKDLSMRGFGGQVTTFKTEAQKKAATLAADRSESGPIDKDKLREHVARLQFEDQLRSGQNTHDDLVKAVEEGLIGPKDAKVIMKNVQETRGMDPNLARLYTRAGRLPMSDFLDVWEVATVGEQKVLEKMLQKKRAAYIHKVNTDMSPPQRKTDVTYQRIRRMFPAFAPF